MFKVKETRLIGTEEPIIVGNYRAILSDEDMDVLFIGTNASGDNVIGSSVDEDYEKHFERFFHIIVTDQDMADWLRRKKTYRSLLENARPIYIVDRYHEPAAHKIYHYSLAEIPKDYIPLEDTFCPDWALPVSYQYASSLKGGLADRNIAVPHEAGETQVALASLFDRGIESLRAFFQLDAAVYALPSSGGSFTMNYQIEVAEKPTLFPASGVNYAAYLNQFVSYCINDFPDDADSFLRQAIGGSSAFNALLDTYWLLGNVIDDTLKEKARIDLARHVAAACRDMGDATKDIGGNFDKIVISNVSSAGPNVLGVLQSDDRPKILNAIALTEPRTEGPESTDKYPRPYTLHIVSLHVRSRKGIADVLNGGESNQRIRGIRIEIEGSGPLEETQYTESLYRNKPINVRAITQRAGDKIKALTILYEPMSIVSH